MIFKPDSSVAPIYTLKPYKQNPKIAGTVVPPKSALPLIAPLTRRQAEPLVAKPYRIMQGIRSISACTHQDAAIDANNILWTWGARKVAKDPEGLYSFDTRQDISYVPQKRMENASMVSCGALHTMCITMDNRLWGLFIC